MQQSPPVPMVDLNGKCVMVTGGTGSFGQMFMRTVLQRYRPRKVIIFSRDEHKQADMDAMCSPEDREILRFFIGDVRDANRLEMAMRDVDYVIHAAALKHVPLAEYNPFECIHTNVLGAENVVRAALRAGVKKVMALSTDKAVNPLNLYGASKLAADKIFVAANNLSGSLPTRFAVVRYGNVVGSRGSVVPLFRRLLAQGVDALPITDERMTRFWITLPQSVDFVLSSLALMTGWEIFIPKIPSMRVIDLAQVMAPHLPRRIIGIRPGEKLHEVLLTEDDTRNTVELADRYIIKPEWGSDPDLGGKKVPEGFRYASDNNTWWADTDLLNKWLDSAS